MNNSEQNKEEPKVYIKKRYPVRTRFKKVCIFSTYNENSLINEYVVFYLSKLYELDCDIVLVITSEHIVQSELHKVSKYLHSLIHRENIGYDFGSWKLGLSSIDLQKYNQVIFANDSVYGPIYPLKDIFNEMDAKAFDMWALTDSFQVKYHLMSYFTVYNKPFIDSALFQSLWGSVEYFPNSQKKRIIENYEIGFTERLLEEGVKIGSFCRFFDIKSYAKLTVKNPTIFYWESLIDHHHFPFLKAELFKKNTLSVPHSEYIEKVRSVSNYNVDLILEDLRGSGVTYMYNDTKNVLKSKLQKVPMLYKILRFVLFAFRKVAAKFRKPETGLFENSKKMKRAVYAAYEKHRETPFFQENNQSQESVVKATSTKLIAFYLPQFHPFPENDSFWGKGFTEWTNVSKALPLYDGHYQPRLPGELGFYDLRLKDVLMQQIKLAKNHGVHGFCLHHYFFSGKTVMRTPLETIFNSKDLEINYCLNWANEPWTARFDGNAEKGSVLIEQRHDDEDDLAFFDDVERYFRDKRYIKVNGQPLLLIYRHNLFPNIKKTIDVWRRLAKERGYPGLYLCMFDSEIDKQLNQKPVDYGFDAAIEFPPHLDAWQSIKQYCDLYDPKFKGDIYSYYEIAKASYNYNPDYTLFKGIMPDWDNTARRSNPDMFVGGSPALYRYWLEKQISYTDNHKTKNTDEKLIFVNAWNEWAEGAYLEPDRKYGYSFLNATSSALGNRDYNIAIVAHYYYTDLLPEFVDYVRGSGQKFDIFISTKRSEKEKVYSLLRKELPELKIEVRGVPNRGMDIGPFLIEFREYLPLYDLVLKVHGKKSLYDKNISGWRKYLFKNLLDNNALSEILDTFKSNKETGLHYPEPYPLIEDKLGWGDNEDYARQLLSMIGYNDLALKKNIEFPSGSMFFFRPAALLPMFQKTRLGYDDFPERYVVNGSLAHAAERLFREVAEREGFVCSRKSYFLN